MPNTKIVARPWQPQDLIDDLQGIIDEECDNYMNTRRTTLCMARDYLKEHFAEPKWIPVSERLPNDNERVLACYINPLRKGRPPRMMVGEGTSTQIVKGKVYLWCGGWRSITHWMPLPDPPKGE